MKHLTSICVIVALGFHGSICAAEKPVDNAPIRQRIAIEWQGGHPAGQILVSDGLLEKIKVVRGSGDVQSPDRYGGRQESSLRLELQVRGTEIKYGKGGTIVTVTDKEHPFSFFLRDVNKEFPIYIPSYGVIVTTADDQRTYKEIGQAIHAKAFRTKLQQIEAEPEESFESAAANTRELSSPTWLGLGRDIRIFELGERLESVKPRFHGVEVPLPEARNKPVQYDFLMGRGWGVVDKISRRLEKGVLPILEGTLVDDDVTYELTAFVTLESSPLTAENVQGTDYLVADGHGLGHMFTKEQQTRYDSLLPAEMNKTEETVLCMRLAAVNTASVPRYAFFRNVSPNLGSAASGGKAEWSLDGARGFGMYRSGRVYSVSKLNGIPLAEEEVAIKLQPGETATLEINLPHRPITAERASRLAALTFTDRLSQARRFWEEKLAVASQIDLPEKRITEMIRAGLLHLDLVAYGREPRGTLVPAIGIYTAIGSESSPIIQFMDSMGWHDEARRALMFFLDKQHDDGLIQNFGGYMLETGAALWSMGEHYRYTRDDEWVKQIEPRLLKACDFLLKWRQRNLREDLRGNGYGMLEGKVADPEDPFRSFMLNGYAYLGLSRVAEMLMKTNANEAQSMQVEADALKRDIRTAVGECMAKSPVVPLGDGTWCPTLAPWVEYRGPVVLNADGGKWFSHGTMMLRDSVLGPLYLAFQEVLDPKEQATDFLLGFHSELMTKRNVAFSQPYYSRHPMVHLLRGEVKPFLKAYYNSVAGLADRQTYTFWEHFFHASPHKTHEEAWFLMETRWMLYMERGSTLQLLPGVPRDYLEDGKRIVIKQAASYFGPISVVVESNLSSGQIVATVECKPDRGLRRVELRLPHPQNLRPTSVTGGQYDAKAEIVIIEPFAGRAEVTLRFGKKEDNYAPPDTVSCQPPDCRLGL
jgi:hypothetical protein